MKRKNKRKWTEPKIKETKMTGQAGQKGFVLACVKEAACIILPVGPCGAT